MFAKFSPDSSRVAYVRDNDLYLEDLRTDNVTRLTHDGFATLANGTFDWVYEEEFFLRDGFRWSPDGTRIAFWQIDSSLVSEFLLVNNTRSLYPEITKFPYPKAGEINPAARIGIIPAGGGETVWAKFRGSPRDFYLARMDWMSRLEIVVQRLNRRQNRNEVVAVDVRNGEIRDLFDETDSAWVEIRDDLHWIEPGSSFTWVSERDGWRRAYRISDRGRTAVPLTPPGVDIMRLAAVAPGAGWLYYIASPDNAGQRFLYRARLDPDGSPEAERITPIGETGTHGYQIAPGGGFAVWTRSDFDTPPRTAVVSLPDHAELTVLQDNAELVARVREIGIDHAFERVAIADGTELDAWVMYPPGFDPERRYPVLFHVYGEPWGQTVLDRWGGRQLLWHRYLNELGYVVMSVDNRGTPAPRGRDWRKVVYGEVGTLAAADQAAAVRALSARHAWMDPDRIAIWGWSGGGSMTLNAMFRYPALYQTGMSVAPVPDQRYYNSIYQERYMGTPQANPEGYRSASPISYAEGLEGNLLIVHGTGDDNVHYQGTEALINRLIAGNRHFTMMAYPNRSHGIFEGSGTTRHLYGLLTRYLTEHTPPGDPGASG
jgi:dipeptidyl-peptidase-4